MCAHQAMPAMPSPLGKKVMKIKTRVDNITLKMQKNPSYTPTRNDLEECAEQLIDFINDNHAQTLPLESYLKAAIIDLTEVPEMAPQMQRISFLTALKDASNELNLFISSCK